MQTRLDRPVTTGGCQTHRSRGRVVLWILVGLAFAVLGMITAREWLTQTAQPLAMSVFPKPRPLAPFVLFDGHGEPFDQHQLEGRWTLMFFGFTHCPDICPNTLGQLAEAMRRLEEMRRDNRPSVVFVSVDPSRDHGTALTEYVHWFDSSFRAVTGTDEELQRLTRQLGVIYYRDTPDPDTGYYAVDHSGMVLVFDPQGRLYGRFAQPIDTDDLVADLFRLSS